jgi:outer membrane protein TolC
MSTRASIPELETGLQQARNALSVLLGQPSSDLGNLLNGSSFIPPVPERLAVGLPADLLRRRPDVRQAEYIAMAQNAQVGLAQANLYPSFSLSGSLGLSAAGNTETTRTGESGIGQLFDTDSVTYAIGPSFVWPFLNYDRIKNSVRVQDARLQQALIAYRDTVLQAAREAEDALVALEGAIRQEALLRETVANARRSTEVAQLRFNEGLADYQRVLDAQQALFSQQSRYVTSRSNIVGNFIALYLALGGGWETRSNADMVDEKTRDTMIERTDWGDLIDNETEQ